MTKQKSNRGNLKHCYIQRIYHFLVLSVYVVRHVVYLVRIICVGQKRLRKQQRTVAGD